MKEFGKDGTIHLRRRLFVFMPTARSGQMQREHLRNNRAPVESYRTTQNMSDNLIMASVLWSTQDRSCAQLIGSGDQATPPGLKCRVRPEA